MWWWDGQRWQPTELHLSRLRGSPAPPQASHFPVVSCLAGCASFVMIVVGAAAAVIESNNHDQCQSGLGQLAQGFSQNTAQQCAVANTVFYAGIAISILGGFAFLAALLVGVLRYRR